MSESGAATDVRGLPGELMTECSVVFLYMLCSMSIKPNLQKVLGHAPPKATMPQTLFGQPTGY